MLTTSPTGQEILLFKVTKVFYQILVGFARTFLTESINYCSVTIDVKQLYRKKVIQVV